jgi:hypothetical protein
MDTSLSIKSITELEIHESDRLFYDQYEYGVSFHTFGVSALRELCMDAQKMHNRIDRWVENRSRNINYGGNWNRAPLPTDTIEFLHKLGDFLHSCLPKFHLVVSVDWAYIYTNDLEMITQLQEMSGIKQFRVKKALITRPKHSVLLGKSDYTSRTYFKERWVTVEKKHTIQGFLKNQENIRIGPGMQKWFDSGAGKSKNSYMCRNFFFDHNSSSIPFMLELAVPGVIRRTAQILTK